MGGAKCSRDAGVESGSDDVGGAEGGSGQVNCRYYQSRRCCIIMTWLSSTLSWHPGP